MAGDETYCSVYASHSLKRFYDLVLLHGSKNIGNIWSPSPVFLMNELCIWVDINYVCFDQRSLIASPFVLIIHLKFMTAVLK